MRHFSCMIATVSSLNHHNQASWVKDVSWVCLNVKEVFCHPAAQYHRRRRTALWVTISLLTLGLLVLTVGLISATRTDNVPVVGLYPGIIVSGGHLYSVNVLSVMKQTFLLLSQTLHVYTHSFCFLCPVVEFRSISGYCWHPPGGKPQTYGECAPLVRFKCGWWFQLFLSSNTCLSPCRPPYS